MKKTKLFALLSVLLIAAMLLSSCGMTKKISKAASFEKVLNKDYDYSADDLLSGKALPELNHYALTGQSDEFLLFTSANELGLPIYKVFSFRAKAVVQTFSDTATLVHTVSLADVPAFTVSATEAGKTTYFAYDAVGNSLSASRRDLGAPAMFADFVLYGTVLYEIENNGSLTKTKDLPETLALKNPAQYTDEYFYFLEDGYVLIYDREFQPIAHWYAPEAAEELRAFVLNNGNVLLQYAQVLDPNTEKYEVYTTDEGGAVVSKYNLITKLITPKSGKVKDLDMDYVIQFAHSVNTANQGMEEGNPRFADKVDNIAYIFPIVDHRVDDSAAASDVVLMDNNGKIGRSLKLVDGQRAELPHLVGEDIYLVNTLYGRALVNAKGKTLQLINNDDMNIVGGYIIGENAVYNLNMEVAYDLAANDAIVIGTVDDTVLIKKGEDFSLAYNVIALRGGEIEMICRFEANTATMKFISIEGADCYAMYDTATDEYTYFNANGEALMKTPHVLFSVVASSDKTGTVVLMGMYGDVPVYYSLAE